jgi:hypothetical protein
MNRSLPFKFHESQLYGWPFYITRKAMRFCGRQLLSGANALSSREYYPFPIFFRPLLPANAKRENAHRGQRCFVIGNGPSLARQEIEPLAGQITFAMNGFLNHPAIKTVNPTYYCLVDPIYFDGSAPSDRFLDRLFATATQSHFILPYRAAATALDRWRLPPDRATFVAFAGNLSTCRLKKVDLTRPLPSIQNCAQLATLAALYFGCSSICLVGMDHDWAAHRGTDTHFYPQKTLENHPVAHAECGRYPYMTILEDALTLWRGYATLRRHAEAMGVRILNCSDGGFLDVFDRAEYRDQLSMRSAPLASLAAAA